jgi:hypothetical protein
MSRSVLPHPLNPGRKAASSCPMIRTLKRSHRASRPDRPDLAIDHAFRPTKTKAKSQTVQSASDSQSTSDPESDSGSDVVEAAPWVFASSLSRSSVQQSI